MQDLKWQTNYVYNFFLGYVVGFTIILANWFIKQGLYKETRQTIFLEENFYNHCQYIQEIFAYKLSKGCTNHWSTPIIKHSAIIIQIIVH